MDEYDNNIKPLSDQKKVKEFKDNYSGVNLYLDKIYSHLALYSALQGNLEKAP